MGLRVVLALGATFALLALNASVAHAVGATSGREQLRREVGCGTDTAEALVRTFVVLYNGGHVGVIDRLWATEPRFQWFSTTRPGARIGPPAYNRATLAAYFRTRVRVHERIRLTRLRVGYDPKRNIADFNGKLVRSADDLRPRLHDFKGAVDCSSGSPSLIVWSM
jgi:hypothetical protein